MMKAVARAGEREMPCWEWSRTAPPPVRPRSTNSVTAGKWDSKSSVGRSVTFKKITTFSSTDL